MIHTPGFYTDTIGNAYFNGTINALDGWFGTEQHNWYIGTTIITDIMNNDGALTGDEYSYLKATENAAIVVNEWHLQSYATSSDTANYINLVATNEIRFYKNQFKGGTVHFGYRWSDGSTSPLITEYRFNNGNGSPTQVTASQFNGNLNGIATRTKTTGVYTYKTTFTSTNTAITKFGISMRSDYSNGTAWVTLSDILIVPEKYYIDLLSSNSVKTKFHNAYISCNEIIEN